MDIRSWPMDRIMQLPDHCFGNRWPIGVSKNSSSAAGVFSLSAAALPDRCVVWFMTFWAEAQYTETGKVELRLGDHLPVATVDFRLLDPLFTGIFDEDGNRSAFSFTADTLGVLNCMRMPVFAQGRRLVVRFENSGGTPAALGVVLVVSSMPTEVPDCPFSGRQ